MTRKLEDRPWFQIISRCWRPFQQWGFAAAAVAYAFRAVIGMPFDIAMFSALAAASGAGFAFRGIEKIMKTQTVAEHSPHRLPSEAI